MTLRSRLPMLLATATLAGCADPYAGTQEDLPIIAPGPSSIERSSISVEEWMPSRSTRERIYRISWRSAVNPTDGGESLEKVRFVRESERRFRLVSRDTDGKKSREEVFIDHTSGRYLESTFSPADSLRLEPPFLILPKVLELGRSIAWHGTLVTRSERIPARGWTRFRGFQQVDFGTQRIEVLCVETVLVAETGAGTVRLPTSRWFQRGSGAVRVWFQVGSAEYLREVSDLGK